MFGKIAEELIDGKKTYSVSGFAFVSNIIEKCSLPTSMPEFTELFNMLAAIGAVVLVTWRIVNKFKNRKDDFK